MDEVRDWLRKQRIAKDTYISHKAALIASSHPFGLFADYRALDGTVYGYFNGELQTIDKPETKVQLD